MTTRKLQLDGLFLVCVIVVVVYLVLTPLVMLIWNSLKTTPPGVPGPLTLDNFKTAYFDPTLYPLIFNSLIFATGSTLFAFLFAFVMAWLVERTNTPLRDFAYVIAIVATIIPGMIASISWIMLLHPRIGLINLALVKSLGLSEAPLNIHSMYGLIFVGGLRHVPVMFLLLAGALRSMDPSLEDSASTCGSGNSSTMLRITFPLMLPASAAAMIYSFINAIEAFEIPALIGLPVKIHVFGTKIYLAMHQSPPDYGVSAALGTTVLAITAVGTFFYLRILRSSERYVTVTGKGYRPRPIDLGKWKYLGTAFLFSFLILDVILPMLALMWASLLPFYQVPSQKAFELLSIRSYFTALQYPGVLGCDKKQSRASRIRRLSYDVSRRHYFLDCGPFASHRAKTIGFFGICSTCNTRNCTGNGASVCLPHPADSHLWHLVDSFDCLCHEIHAMGDTKHECCSSADS